ncbi:MAG: helix-turn-helix transcriptional regulator [Bacteroidota bacterium]
MIGVRDQELIQKFGNRLRDLRKEKDLSQEKLANLSNVTINQISRIERGEINPTLSTLGVISAAMEVSLKDLLNFD